MIGAITYESPIAITYDEAINGDFSGDEDVQNIINGFYRASSKQKDKSGLVLMLFSYSSCYCDYRLSL